MLLVFLNFLVFISFGFYLVFIRFIYNGKLSEKLLLCDMLSLHTKGEDIFKCLDAFFNEYSIPWENCAGICTDDTAATTDQYQLCSSEMC